jgi:hypothetical protein
MISFPLKFSTSRRQPFSRTMSAEYDNDFMIHLIASTTADIELVRLRAGKSRSAYNGGNSNTIKIRFYGFCAMT